MRIFSGIVAALVIAAAGSAYAGGVKYASPQAAFEQGLGAYKAGYYEIAIPALEEAAAKGPELNRFFAEFYLARIYSDNARRARPTTPRPTCCSGSWRTRTPTSIPTMAIARRSWPRR